MAKRRTTGIKCLRLFLAVTFVVGISAIIVFVCIAGFSSDPPAKPTLSRMNTEAKPYAVDITHLVQLHTQQLKSRAADSDIPPELLFLKTDHVDESTNTTLEVMIHFLYAALPEEMKESYNVDENPYNVLGEDDCAPGYTLGANLTLPAENYMVDVNSATTIAVDYIIPTIEGALFDINKLLKKSVFGTRIPWTGDGVDFNGPDGLNEIAFGSIEPTNILAVTVTYGYFSSYSVSSRRIIERDILFADATNTLGDATVDPDTHDFRRVCVHEMIHGHGAKDVYILGCEYRTIMFGSSPRGRVQPRVPQREDALTMKALYPALYNSLQSQPGDLEPACAMRMTPALVIFATFATLYL